MIFDDHRLLSISPDSLKRPVDVLQIGRWVQVLVDWLAHHITVDGVGVTATAVRLHFVIVDDGGVGQEGGILIQIESMVKRLVREVLVPATVAAVQVLLDVELFRDEVGQVFRFDVAHVQDWRLIIRNELGLDEGTIRRVQLVVQRRVQIVHAN